MQGEAKERWVKLCEQASTEKDADKLIELVKEINRLLGEKQSRLNKMQPEKNVHTDLLASQ